MKLLLGLTLLLAGCCHEVTSKEVVEEPPAAPSPPEREAPEQAEDPPPRSVPCNAFVDLRLPDGGVQSVFVYCPDLTDEPIGDPILFRRKPQ